MQHEQRDHPARGPEQHGKDDGQGEDPHVDDLVHAGHLRDSVGGSRQVEHHQLSEEGHDERPPQHPEHPGGQPAIEDCSLSDHGSIQPCGPPEGPTQCR